MAAIVQFDPLSIFFRRIGYSVGLEYTSERVGDLLSLYRDRHDVTSATWSELVTCDRDFWRRSRSAEQHIADFFFALRLIQRTPSDVIALDNLDAMAIVSNPDFIGNDPNIQESLDFLLLWAILTSDGEIFVNLMLAQFDKVAMYEKLISVISHKRTVLQKLLSGRVSAKKICKVVNIEKQERSIYSTKDLSDGRLGFRQKPLGDFQWKNQTPDDVEDIDISDDYFKKVPPRRRSWAVSLGLWDDAGGCLTARGQYFLESLRADGYIDDKERFIYWPMDYEFVRSGFRPDLIQSNKRSLWDCLVDFRNAYSSGPLCTLNIVDPDLLVGLIRKMIEVFRRFQVRKIMLRRELPLTTAYPAIVALSFCREQPLFDAPNSIKLEQEERNRRITLRRSRSSSGALSILR